MWASLPPLLYLSAAAALIGSSLFGYHLGVLNTCQAHVEADLRLSHKGGGSALVVALLVGATAGSLLSGRVADRLGPRTASALNTAPLVAGAALSATARAFWPMLAGRVLAGVGSGAASVLCPRYLAEIAPVPIRGSLGTLTQVLVNVGILCSYLAGLPYEGQTSTVCLLGHQVEWWRIMFAAAMAPPLLQAPALLLCPESPSWLARRGATAEAAAALRRLHGRAFRPQDYPWLQLAGVVAGSDDGPGAPAAEPLLASEAGGGATEEDGDGASHDLGWAALLLPRYRRVMALAAALPLLQQLSGVNSIVFFSTEVFQRAGLQSPILGSIAVGATNLAITLVAAVLMERVGRRPLTLASFSGMAAALAALAASTLLPARPSVQGAVSLACMALFMVFFALGAGPIPFLYLPEVLPQEIMGTAQAFCTSLNWGSNILIGAAFPLMLHALGIAGAYLLFAAACAGAAAFFARRMVETRNRTVEAIRAELVGQPADGGSDQ